MKAERGLNASQHVLYDPELLGVWEKFALLNSALWLFAFNLGSQMFLPIIPASYTKFNMVHRMERGGTWQVLHQWSFSSCHLLFKAFSKDLHFRFFLDMCSFSCAPCSTVVDSSHLSWSLIFYFLLEHWWSYLINGFANELLDIGLLDYLSVSSLHCSRKFPETALK